MKKLACCVQIIDVGTQKVEKTKRVTYLRQIIIGWELLLAANTSGKKGEVYYKTYPMSWDVNSSFRKDIERWNGAALTDDQQRRFNIKSLLGQYHTIKVENDADDSNPFAHQINKVDPLPFDTDKSKLPKASQPFRIFMISEPDMEFFELLPEEIQERIRLSPEFEWSQKAASDDEYE